MVYPHCLNILYCVSLLLFKLWPCLDWISLWTSFWLVWNMAWLLFFLMKLYLSNDDVGFLNNLKILSCIFFISYFFPLRFYSSKHSPDHERINQSFAHKRHLKLLISLPDCFYLVITRIVNITIFMCWYMFRFFI